MSPAMILLRRACDHPAEATYLVPRLDIERRPRSRNDRKEVELFRTFLPILSRHPGDRVAIRRAAPERWQHYLDVALELPEWFITRSDATPDLLALWNRGESLGWQLPSSEPARVNIGNWTESERAA